jgi:hypothetical protein
MICCTKCGSGEWDELLRSAINPAEDLFRCRACGHKFKRYDPPALERTPAMFDRSTALGALSSLSPQEALRRIRALCLDALEQTAPGPGGTDCPAYWHLRAALYEIDHVCEFTPPC